MSEETTVSVVISEEALNSPSFAIPLPEMI